VKKLPMVRAAFGRGETIAFNDGEIELILVKNPSGFRAALLDYGDRAGESGKAAGVKENEAKIMIAINDDYADGRDVSWLWDVDFSAIGAVSMVSGTRAYDMALRLEYDSIKAENIEEDLRKALKTFLGTAWAGVPSGHNVSLGQRKFDLSLDQKSVQLGQRKRVIFCTYTAMLELRKNIARVAAVGKWD
jgi:UDP-N-acetylmuramyl tripeptide synthase